MSAVTDRRREIPVTSHSSSPLCSVTRTGSPAGWRLRHGSRPSLARSSRRRIRGEHRQRLRLSRRAAHSWSARSSGATAQHPCAQRAVHGPPDGPHARDADAGRSLELEPQRLVGAQAPGEAGPRDAADRGPGRRRGVRAAPAWPSIRDPGRRSSSCTRVRRCARRARAAPVSRSSRRSIRLQRSSRRDTTISAAARAWRPARPRPDPRWSRRLRVRPRDDRDGMAAIARATTSSLNAQRSSIEPPRGPR